MGQFGHLWKFSIRHSRKFLEVRLKEILEKIVGVGTVDVLVTLDSTEESILERNTQESQQITDENDPNGGKRHITSITKDGQVVLYEVSGDQKPIITKTINPRIRGILIVAKGAENVTVRRLITNAVEKGINVPLIEFLLYQANNKTKLNGWGGCSHEHEKTNGMACINAQFNGGIISVLFIHARCGYA